MDEHHAELIDVGQLRLGMYIELGMGWLAHPFPTGSFKIGTQREIDIIRSLGCQQVRCVPSKSDPPPVESVASPIPDTAPASAESANDAVDGDARAQQLRQQRAERLAAQQRALALCERRFGQTARQYKQTIAQLHSQPQVVMAQCHALVSGYVNEMLDAGETAIRLLADGSGDKVALHAVNISVIALLLGKQLNLSADDMANLGLAALLHDIGKQELPMRVRWLDDSFSAYEVKAFQTHVAQSVLLGQRLGLPKDALLAVAQHHEHADGSGFPARLKGDAMTLPAKILALVNHYENLCNPSRPSAAMTPHEALALIFAQHKSRFDASVLSAFIRMMGVYPPGSLVQLNDERFAMVVSVNSARPLRPDLIVADAKIPKHEALILNLEAEPDLCIKRSLKPANLPLPAFDYLSPRQRMCYFFECVTAPANAQDVA